MIFLITYDLRTPGRNYNLLYDAIKELGDNNHPLESVWFVKNDILDPLTITRKLKEHMDNNDLIFVVEISNSNRQGWLPKNSWEWLDKYQVK